MGSRIYVNTFGSKSERSFSTNENYHYQVMQALTERGYSPVQGSALNEGTWVGEDGGYIVYAKLAKGGKAVFFMAQTQETAKKVSEAVKMSIVGIHLDEPVKVEAPE